ncbi:MAG: hypothetical protein HY912_10250, partial [Desulfomonile tiedjei]|nr:hypothetical protein [Desulfomonile tiedjei]
RPVLQIRATDRESMDVIAGKIQKASAKPGFNRAILAIKTETEEGPSLRLMGPAKGAPSAPDSERPESLTGVQGVKPGSER